MNYHHLILYSNSKFNAYHPVLKTKLAETLASGISPASVQAAAFLKPKQQINEYGGTFGGPIVKNRTFFFFDYAGTNNNLPFPANTTVPTSGAKSGDFSQYLVKNAAGAIIATALGGGGAAAGRCAGDARRA